VGLVIVLELIGIVIDDDFVVVGGTELGVVSEFWLIPKFPDNRLELKISREFVFLLLNAKLVVVLPPEVVVESNEVRLNDGNVDEPDKVDSKVLKEESGSVKESKRVLVLAGIFNDFEGKVFLFLMVVNWLELLLSLITTTSFKDVAESTFIGFELLLNE